MQNILIEKIHETFNYSLLKDVYYNILIPCFPNPDDHLSWFKVKYMIKKNLESQTDNDRIIILVSKEILPDGSQKPISFILGVFYKKSQTGLISYMGVLPGHEKSASNIQNILLDEMQNTAIKYQKKLKAGFSMVELPQYSNTQYYTIDPVLRIKIMERRGARHIPISFVYPSFGSSIFSYLLKKHTYKHDAALLAYKVNEQYPTDEPELIKNFIDDFYKSYDIEPQKDLMVLQMKKEIDNIPIGTQDRLSKKYKTYRSKL